MKQSIITGTGSYIPEIVVKNDSFINAEFFERGGERLGKDNAAVIDKFAAITGIVERRYAQPEMLASDLGYFAAREAIQNADIDQESLNYIIVAHNFGDVAFGTNRSGQVPTLASRIKALLQISNPDCVAYDLPFGCPGWIEGMIQANYFIKSGDATRCLVIGTETLSRVIDPHDRDSMIFGDGAGATVLEAADTPGRGIISHKSRTYAGELIKALNIDHSSSPHADRSNLFLKMDGRKVYEFALKHVPELIKQLLDKAGIAINQVSQVLIHQANEKMDHAILSRLFQAYNASVPDLIMPMTIDRLGNSSVATVPTLLDLLLKRELEGHSVVKGDIILMASVGAGMNINALLYRI